MSFQPHLRRQKKHYSLQKNEIWQNAQRHSPEYPGRKMGRQRASCRALQGNLTVEAAIALPLFLFAVINLLSLFLMFQEFSVQEGRLHQTGRMLSMLAHGQESGEADIRLVRTERVEPLIPVAGFPKTFVASGCVMHKWIGFALGEEEGNGAAPDREELVFITSSGTAWHRDRGCGYLNPQIELLSMAEAGTAKNSEGQAYTPCLLCRPSGQIVYVTRGGERYHGTVTCSGLRRNISSISLKEAEGMGRHACPECG